MYVGVSYVLYVRTYAMQSVDGVWCAVVSCTAHLKRIQCLSVSLSAWTVLPGPWALACPRLAQCGRISDWLVGGRDLECCRRLQLAACSMQCVCRWMAWPALAWHLPK
ncbi:hypothetical protein P280DRAFT_227657 [Massarina eburnea CBS 473.64]|uniref:Uncharacterized protein n=1 Tax=Massarina eburnea CBS 473.64 TaxID=1395130 RepID=A0A6A6S8P0_9PLEO|nr:hypothetical protein P280DRAFT_227657 [Massarina eburnea CBS 473.64]